jgi:predicted transcriptional regulator
MAKAHDKLSRREREILDILFALGNNGSAEDVRARLSDPPSYSAVRAMLVKLEAKGVIRHRAEGLRYVYSPVASKSSAQRRAVAQLLNVFFGGSPSLAAKALLRQEHWSDDELDALRSEIDTARKNRRQS